MKKLTAILIAMFTVMTLTFMPVEVYATEGMADNSEEKFQILICEFFEWEGDLYNKPTICMSDEPLLAGSNEMSNHEKVYLDCTNDDPYYILIFVYDPSEPYSCGDYALKVNGYINNRVYPLAKGENYYKLEYKGKEFDVVLNNPTTDKWEEPFEDVTVTDSAYNAIKYCNMKGFMLGTSDYEFTPDAITTRAMVVTTLYRIAGSPKVEGVTNEFSDVQEGTWYYDAVIWASSNGIINGYGDGTFGTNDNITREQFATVLYRYIFKLSPNAEISYYVDAFSKEGISDYAIEPMECAFYSSIIRISDFNDVLPKGYVTRRDLAVGIAGLDACIVNEINHGNEHIDFLIAQ